MKKLKKSRLFNIFLVLVIFTSCTNLALVHASVINSDPLKILIHNPEELIKFANNCSLDTYSQKKTFILTQDIDITGYDFTPIPTFGGIFDGNGHTIKGLNISETGSNMGLFRYLQDCGTIKSLNVIADISPDGTQKNIGGIVGTNKGRLLSCTFQGTVGGKDNIGGIVGLNESTGYISNCKSSGFITGERFTGGITGSNHGIIIQCSNKGKVNTLNTDTYPDINDMRLSKLTSSENVIVHTDTGGIAGFSDGIVQSCQNGGRIGYQHVGYNVGGIIGRQSGYMSNCKNFGEVLGRKDVGGVVGQMEPYLQIKFSEDTLQKLDTELDSLKYLVDKSLDDFDSSSQDASDRLSTLNNLTSKASDELQEVIHQTTNFTDDTVKTLNEISFRISIFLEDMEPVLEDFNLAGENMTSGLLEISKGFSDLKEASSNLTLATQDLKTAFTNLSSCIDVINQAMRKIKTATELLQNNLGDPEKVEQAKKDLDDGFAALEKASNDMTNIINIIADTMANFGVIGGVDWVQVSQDLISSSKAFSEDFSTALKKIRTGLSTFSDVISDDVKTLKRSLGLLNDSFELLEISTIYMQAFIWNFNEALSDIEKATEFSTEAMDKMSKGSELLSISSDYLNSAVKKTQKILDDANSREDIKFPELGKKINEPTDSFFATFDEISKELDTLNNESSTSRTLIVDDLKEINAKISSIFKIIIDARKRALEGVDLYEDISQDSPDSSLDNENSITKGHVTKSVNNGKISGDINVGGVAGSMAIEYDFDPEGDIVKDEKSTLKFKYQTTAVLYKSINRGKVTSKKDYAGGVAGRMELGLLSKCENYGHVNSSDGDFVGGISGSSSSTIKNSYAKCMVSGNNYVGGVTGQGENVYNCYTMVKISDAKEYMGSISGEANGEFKNNYFVKDKWAGIDNISYAEKAVPQDYDTFIKTETLPDEFKKFTLNFKAGDIVVKSLKFNYGDSLKEDELPKIPEKKGYYSSWPEYDFSKLTFSETLEAIYTPLITAISVEESPNTTQPLLLIEGVFGPEAKVSLKPNDSKPPKYDKPEILVGQWTASIFDDFKESDSTFTLRYYFPDSKKNIKLMSLKDNKWSAVDVDVDGSYLVFKTSNKNITFCILETPSNKLIIYISIGASVALLVLIILFVKKKKKKKSKKEVAL
ncbi:methyl-accepting chemotaxis protein [Oceanirhabdus sp. W0125-5]|uniref:methyl-accepting chemotaxis protein n=1 Tax=Oceanirhabdus sp. W0125-5 TaxID=2999116 RepID=UPI0022F30E2D|nr:methyl-accepting chemotaxis protein [Oceanirhabdus sp. W0125-5]WBW98873.1 methyl-accepting chemotaxis protein [Oceanirhabdus sp. W0125-5]